MTNTNTKRWVLINKKSRAYRTSRTTRAAARAAKRSTEWIYDNSTHKFVR